MSEEKSSAFLMKTAATASTGAAFVLIAAKLFAFMMTNSVALLSSLMDSFLDAGASLLNMWAVRTSLIPADGDHRFGHGKVEPLAALGQAAFISGSALLLIFQSMRALFHPHEIDNVDIGLGVMSFSVVVTFVLIAFQRYVIKKTDSVAISADYAHYAGDILMNVSVMASLFISSYFDVKYADPVFALLIAVYLTASAVRVVKKCLGQLIDAELPAEEKQKIVDIVLKAPEVSGMHDLRTRSSGTRWFIQLNLELNPDFTLAKAHAIADHVERVLIQAFPNAEIIIHEDPAGLDERHPQWCYEQI